jgi:hypothetical protein
VITTWLACSCCKKKKMITSNPKKVPDSTQDLYVGKLSFFFSAENCNNTTSLVCFSTIMI